MKPFVDNVYCKKKLQCINLIYTFRYSVTSGESTPVLLECGKFTFY